MVAPGYFGQALGRADVPRLESILREALHAAHRRAVANAERKADVRAKFGPLGESLADTRLSPVQARQGTVPAVYEVDPHGRSGDQMGPATPPGPPAVSRATAAADPRFRHNAASTPTQLSRELFASSEGALIDQGFALTQGLGYVVAAGPDSTHEVWDVVGHQRGWEILERGVRDP